MNKINYYLVKNLLSAILIMIVLVVGIDICVTFMVEQSDIGKGDYTTLNAFQFAILTTPAHIVSGFPVICLVGTVIGISLLNHNNEMVIIRTNGYSLFKICFIAVITSFFMALAMLAVNQWLAPWGKQTAEINKAIAKSGGHALHNKYGFWLRASGDFVHIDQILYDGELEGITRYHVEDDELKKITYAERARYMQGEWHAYNIRESVLDKDKIAANNAEEVIWSKFLKPEFLKVVSVDPDDLSLTGLYKYIKYRKENRLYHEQYQLIFWQKLLQPLTVMVMVFLAVPFVFAEVRSTAVSKRLVLSILVGVSYFLLDKVLVSIVQFFELPILLGAMGPAFCFILLALWWLWRSNWRVA